MSESSSQTLATPSFSVTAKVVALDGRQSSASLELRTLEPPERTWLAIKWLTIYWIIAAITVLVPMLHFVLVPAFLVIGIVAAVLAMKTTRRIKAVTGSCPVCGQELRFHELSYRSPLKEICPHCRHGLKIHF